MNSIKKRFLLFLLGCIPCRLFFVFIAKQVPVTYLVYLGYLALLPAFGFMYLFFSGKRTVGLETQGQPIWWTKFRLLHGLFYFLFALYAINGLRSAYQFLLADVCVGLLLFLWHHYREGNFSKLGL